MTLHLRDIQQDPPDMDVLALRYAELQRDFEVAESDAGRATALEGWERLRREVQNWVTLTNVRFTQDIRDPERKSMQTLCDTLEPQFERLDVDFKRAILESPHRGVLEASLGTQAFARWGCDLAAFEPSIQDALTEEKQLRSRYSEIMGAFSVEFQGKAHNLPQLIAYREQGDRELRKASSFALWKGMAELADELDELFDRLVRLRHGMATTLGFENFVSLGYQRMQRVDYDESDVQRFRDEVVSKVVPLAEKISAVQASRLGLESLAWWDRAVYSPEGNPRPGGDHHWMEAAATRFFADFDPRFAEFYTMMRNRGLLDLEAREGKAPGGYCNVFYAHALPFIFANFQGTTADISVFTHEMGHAFQCWTSRAQPLMDAFFATIETAEIPSMSLEYLSLPYLHHFLGERADEFVWIHLASDLSSLRVTALGDHWQHWVYRHPEATPAERRAQWTALERQYQPELDWGELGPLAEGRLWHMIGHFFFAPFYFIDYALAGTIAKQFWTLSLHDRDEAMRRYIALCQSGGSRSFKQTVAHIGMRSPFDPGCLDEIVAAASKVLFAK